MKKGLTLYLWVLGMAWLSLPMRAQSFVRDTSFLTKVHWMEINSNQGNGHRSSNLYSFHFGPNPNQLLVVGDFWQQYFSYPPRGGQAHWSSWVRFFLDGSPDSSLVPMVGYGGGGVDMIAVEDGYIWRNGDELAKLFHNGVWDDSWDSLANRRIGTYSGCKIWNHGLGLDSMVYFVVFPRVHTPCIPEGLPPIPLGQRTLSRMHPNGIWDTSFMVPLNHHSAGSEIFWEKEDHLYIAGRLDSLCGLPRNGIGRISAHTGLVDSTFNPPFVHSYRIHEGDTLGLPNTVAVRHEDDRGRVWVSGFLYYPNDSNRYLLARLLPDGSLDSSFNNFNNFQPIPRSKLAATLMSSFFVHSIAKVHDNLFVIGGGFDIEYQGHRVRNILAVDSMGNILPHAFPSTGIDSTKATLGFNPPAYVRDIQLGPDGLLYVAGYFMYYKDRYVPPILRFAWSPLTLDQPTHAQADSVWLFPNPVQAGAWLQFKGSEKDFSLFSTQGRLLWQTQINDQQQIYLPKYRLGPIPLASRQQTREIGGALAQNLNPALTFTTHGIGFCKT